MPRNALLPTRSACRTSASRPRFSCVAFEMNGAVGTASTARPAAASRSTTSWTRGRNDSRAARSNRPSANSGLWVPARWSCEPLSLASLQACLASLVGSSAHLVRSPSPDPPPEAENAPPDMSSMRSRAAIAALASSSEARASWRTATTGRPRNGMAPTKPKVGRAWARSARIRSVASRALPNGSPFGISPLPSAFRAPARPSATSRRSFTEEYAWT